MKTLTKTKTAAAGALYAPTGVSPEEVFQAIGRLRQEAQDEIDRLLAFLDATEGDPDIEPSLGFPEPAPWHLRPGDADREADVVDQEDDDAFRDTDGAPTPRLDLDRPQPVEDEDAPTRKLLAERPDQVRARKAARRTAGRATHAR